jgi:type II secretory pathway component PulJ
MSARRQRGSTLLELVVATAISMLGLWLAADLLTESARRLAVAGREMRQPIGTLTERLLRRDLQAAIGGFAEDPLGSTAGLALSRPDGETIVYLVEAGALVRVDLDPSGAERGRRVLLRDVVAWRWRVPYAGLLEVEVGWRRELAATDRLATPRWRDRAPGVESFRLLVASRGGGLGPGW